MSLSDQDLIRFLDRANPDAVRLAQSAIYSSGFCYTHLGAADQQRNVGRVSIAVPDETGRIFGRIHRCLKDKTTRSGITQRIDRLHMDTPAPLATRQAKQTSVGYVPAGIDNLQRARFKRKSEISS